MICKQGHATNRDKRRMPVADKPYPLVENAQVECSLSESIVLPKSERNKIEYISDNRNP